MAFQAFFLDVLQLYAHKKTIEEKMTKKNLCGVNTPSIARSRIFVYVHVYGFVRTRHPCRAKDRYSTKNSALVIIKSSTGF